MVLDVKEVDGGVYVWRLGFGGLVIVIWVFFENVYFVVEVIVERLCFKVNYIFRVGVYYIFFWLEV